VAAQAGVLRLGKVEVVRGSWVFALALLQLGCGAGWRTKPLVDGPLPRQQQAQVWTQGRALRWHALVVAADSIRGVPLSARLRATAVGEQYP
jgi:hypothetical protein